MLPNKLRRSFANLQFWWAKKRLTDGVDFALSFEDEDSVPTVEFLKGEYKGVKIQFGVLQLKGEDSLDFTTYVVYNPQNVDVTKKKFDRLTTNLVRVILSDLAVASKVMNESRTHDFDEPSEEREFHEEVDPLLEARVSKRKPRKKAVRTDTGVHPQVQQPAKPKRTRARTSGTKRPK